jgi:hypothetical protein
MFGSGNWDFWQYSSRDNGLARTYGAQFAGDIDLDVANGDLNFVRSFLVPEPTSSVLVLGCAMTYLATARRRRR